MKINISPRFKRSYQKLSQNIQLDFDKKIKIFANNPRNSILKTHKLEGKLQSCLSFCLKQGHWVLFEFVDRETVNLLDVGSHDKYRKWPK